MPEKAGGSSAPISPNKLDRFLSKLGRTMATPRNHIRSRRGGLPTPQLDIAADQEDANSRQPHVAGALNASIRTDTMRKRERVAELRRQREQKERMQQQRRSRALVTSPGNVVSGASIAAIGSPGGYAEPLSIPHGGFEDMAKSDEFFNDPQLDLLMHPLDPESAVADIDPVPPSQRAREHSRRPAPPVSATRGAARTPAKDEFDFTINIPSTTLSPLVPRGADRRQRARAAVFMADGEGRGRQGVRPQSLANVARVADSTQASRDVYQQIEAEMAQNKALKRELAQLDATVKALEQLVVAGHSLQTLR
ncbi:hypothetical protein LPJ78_000105 [Coemansia sp. RSA 989]|nr:hypothetical protein LPJ68_000033 [Coemansia sp. RSA 1086]KAJ1753584.1 hypothetical protein LPJ79_000177 [Coemansia sp. RSA 1821]KAJ1868593.1 hypothetical protein LPJ78_000105 [Coemansia sp. RSA 989]KAJ1876205.1 hypothetical protein LPJ55_000107 [Coemansia sp. RSA 990]